MTAEVVVVNRSAIALAADSKVTVGGSRLSKTYDTVNKLFTLSKYHPVGIMIYGNADFMEYPWETVIKEYRRKIGTSNFSTIVDWSRDFQVFVRNFGAIRRKDKLWSLKSVCESWFDSIIEEADDIALFEGVSVGSADYIEVLKECIQFRMIEIQGKDAWLPLARRAAFIKTYGPIVDSIRGEFFGEYKDASLSKLADDFISAAIFFKQPSPQSSGIVIAGFGADELFPSSVTLETDGYVGNALKIYQESVMEITRERTGAIRAFAQQEMVQRFMKGIDPSLTNIMLSAFGQVLTENCEAVLSKYGTNVHKRTKTGAVRTASLNSMQKLVSDIMTYLDDGFSKPILRMISMLPKEELANLAESLVALTSLKRRVSSDLETVGGAIDVALISKGDGFVWIKRKHYFPTDINPHFPNLYLSNPGGNAHGTRASHPGRRGHRTKTSPKKAPPAAPGAGSTP